MKHKHCGGKVTTWINIPIKADTHEILDRAREDKSFNDFIRELLDPKSCSTCKWADACNLVHEFLNGSRVRYCSEYKKEAG